jgi:hypothetical protein
MVRRMVLSIGILGIHGGVIGERKGLEGLLGGLIILLLRVVVGGLFLRIHGLYLNTITQVHQRIHNHHSDNSYKSNKLKDMRIRNVELKMKR